jgi:ribosomal peptide maturation radical SAM protein 1
MYRIALINMPFASLHMPSIALTQLKSVMEQTLNDQVEVKIFYLNHEIAELMGIESYGQIEKNMTAIVTGLGDWFFKSVAFPDLEDNTQTYFGRYLPTMGISVEIIRELVKKRQGIESGLESIMDQHGLHDYNMAGFTTMFSQNVASLAMAKKLKDRNPEITTVLGGANCEMSMGRVIAKNALMMDYVFSGPALISFPHLVECLIKGDHQATHKIKGVFTRTWITHEITDASREISEELDINKELPLDYSEFLDSFEKRFSSGPDRPSLLFETSRGCWWGQRAHCTFCGLNGSTMAYRSMEPDRAISLFNELFNYAPRVTKFESVDNILPRNYLTDVLPKLDVPKGVSFFYEVRADLKDHEMEVLARAGVTEIQPGIEALATTTLKLMRKGTTSFQNIRFLKNCLRYGIKPSWNLLVGFPGEKEEIYENYVRDLPSLVHLYPPSGTFPIRFDRFSPYYIHAEDYGLQLRPLAFYEMIYPFSPEDLKDMAYFFEDANYKAPYIACVAKWIMKIRKQINYWHTRYFERDGLEKPGLQFANGNGSTCIIDTRDGTRREYSIGGLGREVLDILSSPMKISRLAHLMGDVEEASLETPIASLMNKRLLYQDRDSYMNLIVERKKFESGKLLDCAAG